MSAIKVLLVALVLTGCHMQKQEKEQMHPLEGEWRNLSLRLEMNKKHGDVTKVFEVDETTWEDSLKIRPIRTFYRADGTFNSEHYNLKDSLILNPEGEWTSTEEMITMITLRPFSDTTACTYTIEGAVVTFGCWVDWDEDGEKDDWYVGKQKKY